MFKCDLCLATFTRKDNYQRHVNNVHKRKNSGDGEVLKRTKKIKVNCEDKKIVKTTYCETCGCNIESAKYSAHIKSNEHNRNVITSDCGNGVEKISGAFKSRIVSFRINAVNNNPDIFEFFSSRKNTILDVIKKQCEILKCFKMNFELFAIYVKRILEGDLISEIKSFNTKNHVVTLTCDLSGIIEEYLRKILKKSEEFQECGSGWGLQRVLYLEINFNKYSPLNGSSYIDLPEKIKATKSVINIQNMDDMCFAWSIVAALYPASSNVNRTASYPYYNDVLNLGKLEFPIKLNKISVFEELNDVSINVYGLEDDIVVGPLHYTNNKKLRHVNLLYIENESTQHFCLIKDLSRLVGSQLSSHKSKKWICDGCLLYFRDELKLQQHLLDDCNKLRTYLPDDSKNILKFEHFGKQLPVPFVIYADFESILKPYHTCAQSSAFSHTETINVHEPCSFGYYIKCNFDSSNDKFEFYRGVNCGKIFIEKIESEAKRIYEILKINKKRKRLTQLEEINFQTASLCHICKRELGSDKVKDHDHLTGIYRGAAHSNCNLGYQVAKFVPVVIHNLSGYDSHFIIKEFSKQKVEIIANSMEKYISFTAHFEVNEYEKVRVRFIDSFRFLPSSIDNLVSNLADDQLQIVRKFYPSEIKFNLMKRKGIFPYEYINNESRFDEKQLPPKDKFFSSLTLSEISESDYLHAQKVWSEFEICNLGEYSDLYLKTDVLLLADIFENYRKKALSMHSLDPAQYFTGPGLSWDAMLKLTSVELELLTDIDMLHFIKNAIRGGLCQVSQKYSEANNKYLNNYDNSKDSKFIMYFDANNLYGWAMSQYLPLKNFKWLKEGEIEEIDFSNIPDDNNVGYILEVDLEYPEILHDEHNELPFCLENMRPPYISSYNNKKLIANLYHKTKYVIHYRSLKQCLKYGLKLKKIHRVLQFEQSAWLKPYIDFNNDLRSKAVTKFDKDYHKQCNNDVYGKTMENVDKRINVKLVSKWTDVGKKDSASRLINMLHFHSRSIINEDLVVIRMNNTKVCYNKPIYVGFSVLEMSKTLMYDFHYGYFKRIYNKNANLMYMDTDSFIYEVKCNDFYEDMKKNLDLFDTSDYPVNNIFKMPQVNKKCLGKFKDECAGDLILKFIGLKPKTYCILTENDIVKKVKGINKHVTKNNISEDDFYKCINDNTLKIYKKMLIFKSDKHTLFSKLVNKIALSNDDDKRFSIGNAHNTLAWGHKAIEEFYFN